MSRYMLHMIRIMIVSLSLVILGACAKENPDSLQLKNQDNQWVTITGDKPSVLFFFTTYT
ncbi:hypothetical protein [Ammoniphilus sp. CFH 90114]|uniref:hypothetical protein n=1 Tax=Ammoniphilus sp. CFH 90114 TaxID=2493665 RepID=UPI00100F5C0F|nr:hypothetical protein [Ammoniphilus sp. CFH 90114]RXT15442.1 hypothetical protein EIZ39_04395 [Ammoniphilus sp. CFH 90114]